MPVLAPVVLSGHDRHCSAHFVAARGFRLDLEGRPVAMDHRLPSGTPG